MERWSRRTVCTVIIAAFVLTVMPVPAAHAWKMKTHSYSANLVLNEIAANGGQLEIPPYGKFAVPAEYLDAVRTFPAAYRAGAIGPDGYPDIYVGQAFIHPTRTADGKGTYTDQWLRRMWDRMTAMPPGPSKQEALAFTLGMMTHSAGDVFGHDYINQLSGGPFPAISEVAKDPSLAKIIARHNITEAYIDEKVPPKFTDVNSQYTSIGAPTRFVRDNLFADSASLEDPNSLFNSFSGKPYHVQAFWDLRKYVKTRIAEMDAEIEAGSWGQVESVLDDPADIVLHLPATGPWYNPTASYGSAGYCNIRAYLIAWLADIDAGITSWIDENQWVARHLLWGRPADPTIPRSSDMTEAKKRLTGWAMGPGLKMAGLPDGLVDYLNTFSALVTRLSDWLFPQWLKNEINAVVEAQIYDRMAREMKFESWAEIESLSGDPATWLNNGKSFRGDNKLFQPNTQTKMDSYLGNFAEEAAGPSGTTFAPFHNTVVMAKLVMIGPAGVNALVRKAGYPNDIVTADRNVMLGFVQSLDGSQSWEDAVYLPPERGYRQGVSPLFQHRDIWARIFDDAQTDVVNGSFEDWTAGDLRPLYWSSRSTNGLGTIGIRTDFVRTGKRGLAINMPGTDGNTDAMTDIVVTPGVTYHARSYVVTDRLPEKAMMGLEFLDLAGNPVVAATWTSGDKWGVDGGALKPMWLSATAPAGATRARLYLRFHGGTRADGSAGGSSVWDEAVVIPDLLRNDSFEEWQSSGFPRFWWGSSTNGVGCAERRTDWHTSGANGFGLQTPSTDPNAYVTADRTVAVVPDAVYDLGVNVVTDRAPDKVKMYLLFCDAQANVLGETTTDGGKWGVNASSMKRMTVSAKAPAGAVYAFVFLRLHGGTKADGTQGGSAVFDDISFAKRSSDGGGGGGGDGSGGGGGGGTPGATGLLSIEGANRIETAIKASQAAFPSAETVVIATAYNFPDALGGSALAGALNAPLLLTNRDTLPTSVEAEIKRLGAKRVYVLGSPSAISSEVGTKLASLVGGWTNIKRLGGTDRYGTAHLVAAETISVIGADKFDGTVFLATGENFPDALAASPVAAAKHRPILLTRGAALPNIVNNQLGSMNVKKAIILGSDRAISYDVGKALVDKGVAVERLAGANRYQTAIAVAKRGVAEGLKWDGLAVATGANYPDALAGGVMCGKYGSVMLLTNPTTLNDEVRSELVQNKATIRTVRFLGSPAAVGAGVRAAVGAALK